MVDSFKISVPSKTFLIGEYAALENAPAFILNTQARFEMILSYSPNDEYYSNPIPNEEDPLFQFWDENEEFLLDFDCDFKDPYQGSGGFGASSAQWAMFYAFVQQYSEPIASLFDKTQNTNDILKNDFYLKFFKDFIFKYRSYSKDKFPPSGYDIISQWIGKIAYVDAATNTFKRFDWPFEDLSFVLIKNSQKIQTHQHLSQLENIPTKEISKCVTKVLKSFEQNDSKLFISAINENYEILKSNGLVAEQAQTLIQDIRSSEHVLAAKGCGALGSDVVLVVLKSKNLPQFVNFGVNLGLNFIATEKDLSHGIEIHSNMTSEYATVH